MGANMMPIVKNSGRTVFGVRIGLWAVQVSHHYVAEFPQSEPCLDGTLTAMPSIVVV